MSKIFSQSEFLKKEYACQVVRIGEVKPIPKSDFLGVVEIHPGMPIVVRKDEVKEGDVMFYVDMECQLNKEFLSSNNQFEDSSLNADPNQKGYINKYGRIRMVKLRGQESMGYLFGQEAMDKYFDAKGWDLRYDINQHIGEVFDTVYGELFVKAYVPPVRHEQGPVDKAKRRNKKIKRFDRIIPGEFSFHYDTDQLEKTIQRISPNDVVDISVKLHGTSAIFAHIPVRRQLSIFEKIKKFFGWIVPLTEYAHIYSSRSVIKNQYINREVTPGYYGEDLWGYWDELIRDYIPKDMTIYGEIVGFTPNGSYIQKGFDYGCPLMTSKLMIYRISTTNQGQTYEWNVEEVKQWTENLIQVLKNAGNCDLAARIHPIDTLWHGTLHDLFPEIPVDQHWHAEVIHALANKKEWYMEMNEPLCQNKVPREGIVLRKFNDPLKEAFKLKTIRFKGKEAELMDAGEIDSEMTEGYANTNE